MEIRGSRERMYNEETGQFSTGTHTSGSRVAGPNQQVLGGPGLHFLNF